MKAKLMNEYIRTHFPPLTPTEEQYIMDYINYMDAHSVHEVKWQDVYKAMAEPYHVTPAAIQYTLRTAVKKIYGDKAQIANCLTIIWLMWQQYQKEISHGKKNQTGKYFI